MPDRRPEEVSGFVERALDGLLPDLVNKAVNSGLRSVFATHEGVVKVAESVPKEVVRYIADQVDGMRADIFRIIASELREFLDRINLGKELQRALTALALQVTMEIRFLPSDTAVVRPSVKANVTAKRNTRGTTRTSVGNKGALAPGPASNPEE